MNIIVLRDFIELARRFLAVNHTSSHGKSDGGDMIDELRLFSMTHSIQSPLGEGQIDRSGEVERGR